MAQSEGDNTVDLGTAQKWALTWRKIQGEYNSHHGLHAFHIPIEDLNLLIAENPDAIRAYLGVNDRNEEKLMIVGTKYDSAADVYNDMIPGKDAYGKDTAGKIYDFTRPCPQSCGHNSLLQDIPVNDL